MFQTMAVGDSQGLPISFHDKLILFADPPSWEEKPAPCDFPFRKSRCTNLLTAAMYVLTN